MQFAAIIVSYNPDIEKLSQTINELKRQGFRVIVIDNASANLLGVRAASQGENLVEFPENRGIAAALNEGMRVAKCLGAEWVLSLDQDSEVAPNLFDEFESNLDLRGAGALCPHMVKRGDVKPDIIRCGVTEVERCPTAGFLLKVSAWETVGDYNEWMFIDYVDYDMCVRLRISGFKIYRIESTYVLQELGKMTVHRVPYTIGKVLRWEKLQNFATSYNHSPQRNYYYVRNALYYIRNYGNYIDSRTEILRVIKWEMKKLLLEGHKLKNIKAIVDGIRDSADR